MSTKTDHKRWRLKFNNDCRERDHDKCVFCDRTDNLDVHHITDRHRLPNGGYVLSNGITLCGDHHLLAEENMEDANEIRAMFNHFSPQNLYKKINSSYEQAMSDSLKLI